jgi:protein SCO1/2
MPFSVYKPMIIDKRLKIGGAILGVPLLAVWLFVTLQPIKVLPRLKVAPGYSLLEQHGERFTSDMTRGEVVLYHFAYTRCGAACQSIWQRLQEVQRHFAASASDEEVPFRLVTMTLDASRDQPETLLRFGQTLGADFAYWSFVTGDEATLRRVIGQGFGVTYSRQPDGTVDFLNRFVLVDGWGIVRAEYRFGLPSLAELTRDIELVRSEAYNSQGAAHLVYEAAHLLGCYQP